MSPGAVVVTSERLRLHAGCSRDYMGRASADHGVACARTRNAMERAWSGSSWASPAFRQRSREWYWKSFRTRPERMRAQSTRCRGGYSASCDGGSPSLSLAQGPEDTDETLSISGTTARLYSASPHVRCLVGCVSCMPLAMCSASELVREGDGVLNSLLSHGPYTPCCVRPMRRLDNVLYLTKPGLKLLKSKPADIGLRDTESTESFAQA